MPLTKASLKPKPKKAAPKHVAPAPEPEVAAVVAHDPDKPDHHIIPDRTPIARAHDAVRGCWCFPDIEGNEVRHH